MRCKSSDGHCICAKGLVFYTAGEAGISGSFYAQDGGNLLLLQAFGYSDVTGITFALRRRFRELVWIGLACLALMGSQAGIAQEDSPKSAL